jgi:protein SCO1/2
MHSALVLVVAASAALGFLTGLLAANKELARRHGVLFSQAAGEDIDHTLLTSIVDRNGVLRVQYLGVRSDPDEFRRNLLSLAREPRWLC